MRLTNVLLNQHLGWHYKMKWRTLKRRNIEDTKSVSLLEEMGLPVIDPVEKFMPKSEISDPPSVIISFVQLFSEY